MTELMKSFAHLLAHCGYSWGEESRKGRIVHDPTDTESWGNLSELFMRCRMSFKMRVR